MGHAQLSGQQIFLGLFAVTHSPAGSLFCTAALISAGCILPETVLLCIGEESCTAVWTANLLRFVCSDTQSCWQPVLHGSTDQSWVHPARISVAMH